MNKFLMTFCFLLLTLFISTGCSFGKKIPVAQVSQSGNNINPGPSSTIGTSTLTDDIKTQGGMKKFNNLEELRDFFIENKLSDSDLSYRGFDIKSFSGVPTMTTADEKSSSVLVKENSNKVDYSKTNVQVEGVDEADIIKNDGKYIYALVKNDLFIIDAFPAENAKILSKIKFENRPTDIYLNNNKLIVFGDDYNFNTREMYNSFIRKSSYTFFKVFDISDIENPKLTRDLNLEGNYSNSRMIGDYVYFITNNYSYNYIDNEPVLPRIIDGDKVLPNDCLAAKATTSIKCFSPDIYYFNIPYESYNLTTITAINVKDAQEDIAGDVYIMNYGQNIYVSENNIYLTYTRYLSEYDLTIEVMREIVQPMLSKNDSDKIQKISEVENFILSEKEKMYKISAIIERFLSSKSETERIDIEKKVDEAMKAKYNDITKELEKTIIHKIGINGNNIEYKYNGEVTGQVLNQFSIDESLGMLRIATTKNQTWSRYAEGSTESYNNLYVLDENLKIVGSLEKLAQGERIYSVRFMQDRAYMVTFKQTDPLFVIDLKDPEKPTVLGELKIPGFSNYLHPYDSETLIGIGKDTTENENGGVTTKGLKLSLFDVANVNEPKEIDNYIFGDADSDSIALSDHKAFLFSLDKNLLSIPATISEYTDTKNYSTRLAFSGAAVFKVTKQGFELIGKIDHSDGGTPSEYDHWDGYDYYDNTVKRSLYIDDTIYTFSNNYLKMNDLGDNLEMINNLKLVLQNGSDFEIIKPE